MPMGLYAKNTQHNKTIAIWILLAILLTNLGILQSVGINLASFKLGSWSYLKLLTTLGLAWVTYGLWKNELG